MALLSRKTLFSLALGGLVSTTIAWSQEPTPAPPEPADQAPAASDAASDPAAADRPGVIHVSDCPPASLSGADSGGHCRQQVPPHSGWNPPGRRPMYRTWVPYHNFFPASWTGAEPQAPQQRAPIVYMPTDTTQMGYYYQHAPTWHAYSGMLPPVPRPADWHYIYYEQLASPAATNGQPTHFGQPTVVPEPTPDVPTETGLDRSAARPDLTPITR